jgi:prepilin-type processing-associated H-X9-DG protein
MQRFRANKKFIAAFSRIDLVAVILTLAALGTVATVFAAHSRRTRPLTQCSFNLKELGIAMAIYTGDNNRCLPFAFIKYNNHESTSWDTLIFPFINFKDSPVVGSLSLDKKHETLLCPADTVNEQGRLRRTYAMSEHNMDSINWPPAPENGTGVGLWWSSDNADGNAALKNVFSTEGGLPAVRLDMLAAPAGTLLLTEQARADNVMFTYSHASINAANKQFLDWNSTKKNPYHYGKFNYLMADSHVETLLPAEKPGMWTIRPDD